MMCLRRNLRSAAFYAACLFLTVSGLGMQGDATDRSGEERMMQDLSMAPCDPKSRLDAVPLLFSRMGAPRDQVRIEKYRGAKNVVVRLAGEGPETLIIGAHYDKAGRGCGAVDNWSGVVATAHLYGSLREVPLRKSILFVAFDAEEKGLIGSKAMAAKLGKGEAAPCAMINLDSLGLADPVILENLSSPVLTRRLAALAEEMRIPWRSISIDGPQADSLSFMKKGIPSITISALSDDWEEILHSVEDQVDRVSPQSLYRSYRLALALALELDGLPCVIPEG